jgi:DNA replication protein DnaC
MQHFCSFQLVSRRYDRGSMPITSHRSISEWESMFGEPKIS